MIDPETDTYVDAEIWKEKILEAVEGILSVYREHLVALGARVEDMGIYARDFLDSPTAQNRTRLERSLEISERVNLVACAQFEKEKAKFPNTVWLTPEPWNDLVTTESELPGDGYIELYWASLGC